MEYCSLGLEINNTLGMETILIDKYKQLIIMDDNVTYIRTDVLNEEYKKQLFTFLELKKASFIPQKTNWFLSFLRFFGFVIFDIDGINPMVGEIRRIKLLFKNNNSRLIDTGELGEKELKIIVTKLNMAIKNWQLLQKKNR
jgi:hypothetical protein